MNKQDYLDALKRAMAGLPPDAVAKTLAYYEQRFVDGAAAGLSDDAISRDLDEPTKIAMTLRANAHLQTLQTAPRPVNAVRMILAAFGLAIFNMFMIVPAAVIFALVVALYGTALGTYVGGIAVTASGLAGANELVLSGPLKHVTVNGVEVDGGQTRVTIGAGGVQIFDDEADAADDNGDVLHQAEEMAGHGVRIYTDMDARSRTTQSAVGLGLVVVGILLFLLGIVVTRQVAAGARRYIEMNISLLKGS